MDKTGIGGAITAEWRLLLKHRIVMSPTRQTRCRRLHLAIVEYLQQFGNLLDEIVMVVVPFGVWRYARV